jgi:hypothetical protein
LSCCTTFAEAETIIEEMKMSGIEKAVVTLVGWNLGGHDGAYPQRFPVESLFGGDVGLKRLIGKAASLNYQIVPHDNVTDAYLNAASFDYEYVSRDECGLPQTGGLWSGGQSFKICPTVCMDHYAGDFKRIQGIGFNGSYYLDNQGTGLFRCHDPKHPADERQFAISLARMLQYPRELFGAVSCEGGPVYTLPFVDELAVIHGQGTFDQFKSQLNPDYAAAVNRIVPFYNIAVHGIVLYNWIQDSGQKKDMLKQLAYGARPRIEVSCRASNIGNEFRNSICNAMESYDLAFNVLKGIHQEFIECFEDHNEGNIYKVEYGDGIEIEVSIPDLSGTIRKDGKILRKI